MLDMIRKERHKEIFRQSRLRRKHVPTLPPFRAPRMKPFPISRRRDPLTTSFVSVPTSCTNNGDERTAMRRKTGCILKRRSWVQFSGEQELDSAGNPGNQRACRREGTQRMVFGEGTIRGPQRRNFGGWLSRILTRLRPPERDRNWQDGERRRALNLSSRSHKQENSGGPLPPSRYGAADGLAT